MGEEKYSPQSLGLESSTCTSGLDKTLVSQTNTASSASPGGEHSVRKNSQYTEKDIQSIQSASINNSPEKQAHKDENEHEHEVSITGVKLIAVIISVTLATFLMLLDTSIVATV
jgi:hypothetical protein